MLVVSLPSRTLSRVVSRQSCPACERWSELHDGGMKSGKHCGVGWPRDPHRGSGTGEDRAICPQLLNNPPNMWREATVLERSTLPDCSSGPLSFDRLLAGSGLETSHQPAGRARLKVSRRKPCYRGSSLVVHTPIQQQVRVGRQFWPLESHD